MKIINNHINKFFLLMAGVMVLSASCSDAPDELKEVDFDRVFSVNEDNLTVNVTNKTTLRLTWDKVRNADGYTIELFANDENMLFGDDPSLTLENIEYESPLLIPNLEGETPYSGRIKGVSETIDDSKWIEFSFETDPENIFDALGDGVGATTVELSWPAGSSVTHIIVRDSEGKEIKHELSNSEISTGNAIVTGLTGDTSYSATIYNGEKARGTVSFVTNPDLGDAIQVNPGDNLAEMIASADDETTFALMPGTHQINGTLNIDKSISIVAAYASNKPVLDGVAFNIEDNIGYLSLKNLILKGTYTNSEGGTTTINTVFAAKDNLSNIGDISVESCEISEYGRGFIAFSATLKSSINSFLVDDCIMYDSNTGSNDTFDLRGGKCQDLKITNSTFYNFGARDFIRADNDAYINFGGPMSVTIDHCTFNGVSNGSFAILYIRYTGATARISNSIITNTVGSLARSTGGTVTISYSRNNYFNAANAIANDPSGTTFDPQYADPANGDFTVGQEDLFFAGTGDPRWILK